MSLPRLRTSFRLAGAIALACLLVAPVLADDDDDAPAPHGPATLEFRTLHMYRETMTGGVEEVVLRRGSHVELIKIRSELHDDYLDWTRGAFGNTKLRNAARAIRVRFSEVPTGAEITFTSSDNSAVTALHNWFAEQVKAERARHPSGGPGVGG